MSINPEYVERDGLRRECLTILLAMVVALAVSSPPAFSADDDPPDDSDFQVVEVDLSGRLFKQVLPFDVPFQIQGTVPKTTQRVEARFIRHDGFFRVEPGKNAGDPPTCHQPEKKRDRRRANPEGEELEFDCAWIPKEAKDTPGFLWKNTLPPAAGDTVTFRIALPPLEAKSYYVFKFDVVGKLSDPAIEAFLRRGRAVLEETLATTSLDAFRDASQPSSCAEARDGTLEKQRCRLHQALSQATGDDLDLDQDSLFNLATPWTQLEWADMDDYLETTGDYITARKRIDNNVKSRARSVPDFQARLDEIRGNAALAKLLRSFEATAAATGQTTPEVDLLKLMLDSHQEALAIARYDGPSAQLVAQGQDPASEPPRPRLGTTDAPAVATAFAARYQQTRERLQELQDWLAPLIRGASFHLVQKRIDDGQLTQQDVDDPQTGLEALLTVIDLARRTAGRLENNSRQVASNLGKKKDALDRLVATLEVEAAAIDVIIYGNTLGSFKTQQRRYISADFGFAFAADLDKTIPYVGTNIYFRPVNKNAPLSQRGGFGRRFALNLGLTVSSIADSSPETRKDLFGSNSLLIGAGWRLTDSLRIGGGAILFEGDDPNPLIEDFSLTTSYYVSISFDWDVLSFFRNFGTLFGG